MFEKIIKIIGVIVGILVVILMGIHVYNKTDSTTLIVYLISIMIINLPLLFIELYRSYKNRIAKTMNKIEWFEVKYSISKFISKFTDPFYTFKYGIQNLITWLPIIWNDRQFDHYFMWKIFEKKLKLMEDFYSSPNNYMSASGDQCYKRIKTARILATRMVEDNHELNALERHERKWGELQSNLLEPIENDGKKFRTMKLWRDGIKTKKDEQLELRDSRRCWEHGDFMIKQDIEYFGKLLLKYSRNWWD